MLQRPRPVAGLLFFNDQGDEAGGLTLTGREEKDARTAAFKVWDRPDVPLSELVEKLNAANAIQNQAKRDAAIAQARAAAPKAAQRVFVGKTSDRVASVMLADAQGRNRLALKVDADGNASIEFLDAEGKVVQKVSPRR